MSLEQVVNERFARSHFKDQVLEILGAYRGNASSCWAAQQCCNFLRLVMLTLLSGVSAIQLGRSEEHTSELQSLMRISYAVFCLKKKTKDKTVLMSQQHI